MQAHTYMLPDTCSSRLFSKAKYLAGNYVFILSVSSSESDKWRQMMTASVVQHFNS